MLHSARGRRDSPVSDSFSDRWSQMPVRSTERPYAVAQRLIRCQHGSDGVEGAIGSAFAAPRAQHKQVKVSNRTDGCAGYKFGQVDPHAADSRLRDPGAADSEPLVYLGAVGWVNKGGLPRPVP